MYSAVNLIGAIIGVDEKRAPPWRQGPAVNAVAVVLRCDEGLASHHIQHRLVLASGEPQRCIVGDDVLNLKTHLSTWHVNSVYVWQHLKVPCRVLDPY